MDITCPQCNAPNRSTAQFCDQCGKPLQPKKSESPAGNAFDDASGWKPPFPSSDGSSSTEGERRSERPSTLPEQGAPQQQPHHNPRKHHNHHQLSQGESPLKRLEAGSGMAGRFRCRSSKGKLYQKHVRQNTVPEGIVSSARSGTSGKDVKQKGSITGSSGISSGPKSLRCT